MSNKNFKSKTVGKFAIVFFTIALLTINPFPKNANGQPPPPVEHSNGINQPPGGGAPVGSGVLILTLLGMGYAALKTNLQIKKEEI
jgi:hypothetical protein